MELATRLVTTRSGSRIAVHEGGDGGHRLVVIGGMAVRSLLESPVRGALEAAASNGFRCTAIDLPGSAQSTYVGALTMDTWLADIEEIFGAGGHDAVLWAGASVGAWLMLLLHSRHPEWFRSMCAFAPAIDWDQTYVAPGLVERRFSVAGDSVVAEDRTALAPRSLLVSMAPHHLLRGPVQLHAPLHVIFGGRDAIAPPQATRRLIGQAIGAACTAEMLPEADHGVAKLDPAEAAMCFWRWLLRQA